jgi:hypothetical protein
VSRSRHVGCGGGFQPSGPVTGRLPWPFKVGRKGERMYYGFGGLLLIVLLIVLLIYLL